MNSQIIKKEFKESLFDSKGLWMIVAAAGILSALCFLVVNMKEGSVLAQNDILQYAIKAALFLTLTVSMVLGSSSFVIEREENTMESLLLTPVSKWSLAAAKYLGVMVIGVLLLVSAVPYLAAIGAGSALIPGAIGMLFFGGLLLLIAFVAISIIFSILMNSSKASILTSILVMIVLTFPAMIQGLFKLSPLGLFILKIDPVACCFNMMGKILTDKAPLLSLGGYIFPLVLFAVVSVALLAGISGKIALKGEK
jgi:ABC-2 type transport system permease protein